MKNRIISIILVLVLCFSAISTSIFQASAYSTGYPNTHKNTGNQVHDIISIAKTQVGYTENYGTKYGAWLGVPNTAWCAAFVSWCANQAGIPSSIIPRTTGVQSLVDIGAYHFATSVSGYIPKAGDLMLFKPLANSNNDSYYTPSIHNGKYSAYSHVALVVSSDTTEGTVTIIDGNWSHAVKYRTISLDTFYIASYVTPKYTTGYDHSTSAGNNIYYAEYIDPPKVSKEIYPMGADVELEWTAPKGATSYRVRIYNSDGERVVTETVSANHITISGLENGIYTATVTASFSGLYGQESTGTCFYVQNIANGTDYRTVNEGVYIIKSVENGYTLGVANDATSALILSRSESAESAQKFTVTYVSNGRYRISASADFNTSLGFTNGNESFYYIIEQEDGSYIFELAENQGNVLSCSLGSAAANYFSTSATLYTGENNQKWYLCDLDGNITSARYIDPSIHITKVQSFMGDGKLTLNVSTPAKAEIDKIKVTIATPNENIVTYSTQYTQIGEELIWSVSTSLPLHEAKVTVDYRLSGEKQYSDGGYKTTVNAYNGIVHSIIKDVSYSINEEKLTVMVTTPATNFINGMRISFADASEAVVATTDKFIVSGENYVWTLEMTAPTKNVDFLIDYRNTAISTYSKDYYPVHIKNYENTIAEGIIKSIHQSVVGDEVTFIIKTTKSLSSLRGIMATQFGGNYAQAYTTKFVDAEDCYIWAITMAAPTETGIYRFYPLINSEYLMSEAFTLNVFVPDSEATITNVTHTIVDDKIIFHVTTPCTESINRVKLALASDCSSSIVTCADPVKIGNDYIWELTINRPNTTTAYCFDVRNSETSKYSRNYYYYEYTNSNHIISVTFDTSTSDTVCTVITKPGAFNELKVYVGGKKYYSNDYVVVDNKYVWTLNTGNVSDECYSFDLHSILTGAYLKDYYHTYI
ncbi:MAG: DUF2272 domain-containing protein [Clostridia bacterium]|nr:DUF2272 domain-containing protein [Clostridia bacterium]